MTLLPKAHDDFPSSMKSMGGLIGTAKTAWRAVAAVMTPDLCAVIAFCLIGLLLALNLILRFPDFGAVIEQYNQF
jgi:hypothetical protein